MPNAQTTGRKNDFSWRKFWRRVMVYGLLILAALIVMSPTAWGIIISLKTEREYASYPIQWLPKHAVWSNYVDVFVLQPFMKHGRNSLFLASTFAALTVITSSMSGFAFARISVPGRNRLFQIVVALLIIPNLVYIIPQYMLFSRLHLTNSYWPWVLWGLAASPFHIFLFRQFFAAIPRELEDAAEVDGATPFRVYWQIFLPNAKPAIAISFIFNFVWVWGDVFTPVIYLNDRITTLAVKLARAYIDPQGHSLVTVVLAASVVYTLPMVVIFFLGQKHILRGVVTSGLKG